MTTKKVYEAIAGVTAKLAVEGISKDRKNTQQGYAFRGIDDVYNALAPFLAGAKLCILPAVLERGVVERETKNGGALFYVTVKVDFAFVSAEDGSDHHVVTYGEAMDSGDKATNKAMSAAYKYACMQAFCIPTEGDNDADKHTHEVKAAAPQNAPTLATRPLLKATITPASGAKNNLDIEQIRKIDEVAAKVMKWIQDGSVADAVQERENSGLDADEYVYFWTKFDSKTRRQMKDYSDNRQLATQG